MESISKAEKSKVTTLFNLLAEAFGEDPNDWLHRLKYNELVNHHVDENSKLLLQQMAELQKENNKLRERKEDKLNGRDKQNKSTAISESEHMQKQD
ncbi:hypothetical protein [Listeria seeligeri]|uniref:hypothetical protein n=1 Tax=Listeria seeligeri TaxID=1640 RepID=UPI0022EC0AE9|nr:hypothetical protein [Listeria seeligeri]